MSDGGLRPDADTPVGVVSFEKLSRIFSPFNSGVVAESCDIVCCNVTGAFNC